ncbi:hypothetical protein Agub_g9934 [Astrephomene gubernaculifera]|uniref:cysteine--tRNA ligase n=1 Tax=Astrephomene gubernaculifera TaxID=47775 RepID=A0AAD3HPP5_9CHLO|nr:hypothetical protein Agub_g9934 [Astrephomene gubernaculifera]
MSLNCLSNRHQQRWIPFTSRRPTSAVMRPVAHAVQAVQAATEVRAPTAAGEVPSQAALRERVVLYNTMARGKEPFRPLRPDGPVSMYVCGVTVYDYSHIGHARVYVAFDTLYRFLTAGCGYPVTYVRNFTDIDDKIIARAQQSGVPPSELTERFIAEFHKDMSSLRVLPPSLEPRATAHIPAMIAAISDILAHGHAYVVEGGDVFFDVGSLEGYGRLSGRAQEDNRAGERVAVDPRKRSAADFALWKGAKAGEPAWPSPWGPGRPGWHIECSAMVRELLGPVIDIHGGGRDLVFPHHENELAQSQAACGCGRRHPPQGGQPLVAGLPDMQQPAATAAEAGSPLPQQQQQQQPPAPQAAPLHNGTDFVRYWLHNGFVNVDSEKMSKSLGNFFTIRDVLCRYPPLALRWFLLAAHYRAPLHYSDKGLEEASSRLYYVLQARADVVAALREAGAEGERAVEQARALLRSPSAPSPSPSSSTTSPTSSSSSSPAPSSQAPTSPTTGKKGHRGSPASPSPGAALLCEVLSALADDLNTPAVLAALSGPLRTINELTTTRAGRRRPDRLVLLAELHVALGRVMALLGLGAEGEQQQQAEEAEGLAGEAAALERLLEELRASALVRLGLTAGEVADAIRRREQARLARDFAAADAIRVELAGRGVLLLDTPQGTAWRPGSPASE